MQTLSIIGAGISGLALGHSLKDNFRVQLFEGASKPGGLIQCETVQGNLFHTVGGHVFNAKNKEVFDWFWSFFDKEGEFVQAKRNAKIWMNNQLVGYPIENHLYQLDKKVSMKVIDELMKIKSPEGNIPIADFESFLLHAFGPTLYSLYFQPYNTKIWRTDLSTISLAWLEGKLPMASVQDILFHNIHRTEENEMVHATFYYPKSGGGQFIANRLARDLDIFYQSSIWKIEQKERGFLLNGSIQSDRVVYTGDVRKLAKIFQPSSDAIKRALDSVKTLRSNGTSTLFCECDANDLSWLYLPEPTTSAHRIIYTGNFSALNNNTSGNSRRTCVVEFSGKVSPETMAKEVLGLPGRLKPIDHHYEPNSYVIQTHDSRAKIEGLKQVLEPLGIYLLGRFAEWEYYNMDKGVEAALFLKKQLGNSIKKRH